MKLFDVALIGALTIGGLAGCDDEGPTGPTPPTVTLPDEPEAPSGPGNLTVAQRGLALDLDDFAVLTDNNIAGISIDEARTSFGRLVVNRPYVDWRASTCVDSDQAPIYQPRAQLEDLLDQLDTQKGLTFDKIAVNVDLLSPARNDLIFVCYGADQPRFDVIPHREAVIAAFVDLARVPGVDYITVGMEMNRYYHLRKRDARVIDDYTNFITLYREIYAAIKAEKPSVQVGPGLSWSSFTRRTIPEIAEELKLDETGMEAFYRAWQRTVLPFIGTESARTADFVGLTMIPFQQEAPFDGSPNEDIDGIIEHHRRMPTFADGLPVVFPQVDWSTSVQGPKGDYLRSLKAAVAHVDLAWMAWRRTSNLPNTADASPCAKYTQAREASLAYPADFCTAGLVSDTGARKPVLDVLLQ